MMGLSFEGTRTVLCLGAHADDIEIGCGASIASLIEQSPDLEVQWVVFSAQGVRADEARASADDYLSEVEKKRIRIAPFQDGFFPKDWGAIKEYFEEISTGTKPDLVLTHFRDDRHQDHRVISDLTWNTFRNHTVLEYEILKYDGDLGVPNVYAPVSKEQLKRKIERLHKHFATQAKKHWFDEDSFSALPRIRGVECAASSGFAEAFYGRKLVLNTK